MKRGHSDIKVYAVILNDMGKCVCGGWGVGGMGRGRSGGRDG